MDNFLPARLRQLIYFYILLNIFTAPAATEPL